jgi:hypothetical protein
MKPAVQVKHMDEDKGKGDVSGHPLKPVPLVARKSVIPQVRVPALSDPNPNDRVEEDGQEDEGPLNDGQKRDAVDRKHSILKYVRPATEA